MHCMTQLIQIEWNPSLSSTCEMNLYSILSYRFDMFVFTAIVQFFSAFDVLRKCRTSWVIKTLSAIAIPEMKAVWFLETIEPRTVFSLVDSNFEIIL